MTYLAKLFRNFGGKEGASERLAVPVGHKGLLSLLWGVVGPVCLMGELLGSLGQKLMHYFLIQQLPPEVNDESLPDISSHVHWHDVRFLALFLQIDFLVGGSDGIELFARHAMAFDRRRELQRVNMKHLWLRRQRGDAHNLLGQEGASA
eukprot:CAMPEP_0173396994 /NCGR_PEP_ID=MMETSP1356-20130122/37110_1 /TAXON_ID=77927 ORGANISM="Hemiselmis virescens, Strain PCC157" /NCGR_SAMPLE_ID=MMETSP1356 /ASSEMBLY_ACC=CAM_ASM_000847 /LENGTH=148 /DNA_ID=CAMNT_0014356149 /DNA_START=433 /DNA_END=879 /DNA_ORIENTATION=+